MYERFTDRARKVLQLANQEAQRLNHEYVGTEHLLIGLCKEDSGVAAKVFHNLGINRDSLMSTVRAAVQPAPEMVLMGKLPLTPRTRVVLNAAENCATAMRHNYVGTEHLLLGLASTVEGIAYDTLSNLGATAIRVEEQIKALVGVGAFGGTRICGRNLDVPMTNETIAAAVSAMVGNDALIDKLIVEYRQACLVHRANINAEDAARKALEVAEQKRMESNAIRNDLEHKILVAIRPPS